MRESAGVNAPHGRAMFINDRPVQQEGSRSSARNGRSVEPLTTKAILAIGVISVITFFVVRPAHVTNGHTADTRPPAFASYDSHPTIRVIDEHHEDERPANSRK